MSSLHEKEIPQILQAETIHDFIKESLMLIKQQASKEIFFQKLQQLGIRSRVTFHKITRGQRKFSATKVSALAKTMDMSFIETEKAMTLITQSKNEPVTKTTTKYITASADILSDPINTLILNLCGLNKKLVQDQLIHAMQPICNAEMVISSINSLLAEGLLIQNEHRNLIRSADTFQLSTPNGVKLDSAKSYIQKSLQLAEKNYDLPLEDREYSAFTARIKKEDFLKLKDKVRNLRKEIYQMSVPDSYDSVIHVNINAFLIATVDA